MMKSNNNNKKENPWKKIKNKISALTTTKKKNKHEIGEESNKEFGQFAEVGEDLNNPPQPLPSLSHQRQMHSNGYDARPHLKVPQLKNIRSNDETKYKTAQKNEFHKDQPHNTSHSEIEVNAWMQINENEVDEKQMQFQASKKCGSYDCPCSKRLKYVMAHCHQFQPQNDKVSIYTAKISTFMSSLNGYSTNQLSYDFDHLRRYHMNGNKDDDQSTTNTVYK
eukprot:539285_1